MYHVLSLGKNVFDCTGTVLYIHDLSSETMSVCILSAHLSVLGGNRSGSSAVDPETRALMGLIQEGGFTLSVSLDGGSVLATYSYDGPPNPGTHSLWTPDDTSMYNFLRTKP